MRDYDLWVQWWMSKGKTKEEADRLLAETVSRLNGERGWNYQ